MVQALLLQAEIFETLGANNEALTMLKRAEEVATDAGLPRENLEDIAVRKARVTTAVQEEKQKGVLVDYFSVFGLDRNPDPEVRVFGGCF